MRTAFGVVRVIVIAAIITAALSYFFPDVFPIRLAF